MIKKNAPIIDKNTQTHFSLSFNYTFFHNKCKLKWEGGSHIYNPLNYTTLLFRSSVARGRLFGLFWSENVKKGT